MAPDVEIDDSKFIDMSDAAKSNLKLFTQQPFGVTAGMQMKKGTYE